MTDPDSVYRIITAEDWAAAQKAGVVAYGDIDHRDGYLHLSTREQTLETASAYFSGQKNMLVLEVMMIDIKNDCRMEPVAERNGALFPHLYAQLPVNFVRRVLSLNERTPGRFEFGDVAA